MKTLRKYVGYRTLKTAIGAALAIIIAEYIGLSYAVSAGVITVLSVQSTKRKSIDIAIRRLGSTTLAIIVAVVVFLLMGYSAVSFGVYLLIFIPVAAALNLNDGIVPSTVLVTHLLVEESVALSWILNEYGILIVGAGIALLFNIYMPSVEKDIKEAQKDVERLFKKILASFSEDILSQSVNIEEEKMFKELDATLTRGFEKAHRLSSNYLSESFLYYVRYMEMRIKQYEILKQMREVLGRVDSYYEQNRLVASLTELVAHQYNELNTARELMEDLHCYMELFRNQDLPKTREEFENRASLYQYVRDLQTLLEIKKEFADSLTEYDKKTFWKKEDAV
ncbi:aromatic acid exporter family protein [Proteiniclasticum aestuarii]|uniref:aromatic acid exporter family protein n=1 Tax=Proteiniclasticum aestuarii TaxID=2817862 RepID=UPI001F623AB3|nr:aromatic acid exporter family protein [Proteiniclasticum aestuarii]